MKEKGDECIFVRYSTQLRAYKVFNKRTRVIMESIHVNFDELPQMASSHNSSDPAPTCQTMASAHNSSDPAPTCQTMASAHNCSDPAPTCQTMASAHNSSDPAPTCQTMVSTHNSSNPAPTCQTMASVQISSDPAPEYTTSNKLDLLFSQMFDELLNGSSKVVSKSSAVSTADAPNQRQQLTTTLINHTTPTKDHPLEQVIGNPSESVRTRRQLESNAEMCMFALTVSRTEPKNIKEAMADSAWIESMQEELHQFDRLEVWELVDIPLCTNVINFKWLWKNKRDEDNTVIRNKSPRAYRVFNKRTRVIMESIYVNFDELPQMVSVHNSSDPAPTCQTMASVQISSDPAPERQTMALNHDSLSPGRTCQENASHGDKTITTSNEPDLLFSPMFDELLNGSSKVVSKSSAVSAADA
nr:Gag-Pol polyprotein [Tanacetum cinerariifolium]